MVCRQCFDTTVDTVLTPEIEVGREAQHFFKAAIDSIREMAKGVEQTPRLESEDCVDAGGNINKNINSNYETKSNSKLHVASDVGTETSSLRSLVDLIFC